MKTNRTRIAAAATLVLLGGVTAVGLASGDGSAKKATATAPPTEVRTVVVHRTIRVVRREKPRRPRPVAKPVATPAVQAAVAPAAEVAAAAVEPNPAAPARALRTTTSGAPNGQGEQESGDDDGGYDEHEAGDD